MQLGELEKLFTHGQTIDQIIAISIGIGLILVFYGIFVNEDVRKFGYGCFLLSGILWASQYLVPYFSQLTNF